MASAKRVAAILPRSPRSLDDYFKPIYIMITSRSASVTFWYCQVVQVEYPSYVVLMNTPMIMPRLKGFRFPCEILAYAVWAYPWESFSDADRAEMMAELAVSQKVGFKAYVKP